MNTKQTTKPETFTIQLSKDTTLTIDLFSPTGKSQELSIYLENPESVQDLVIIREKQDVDFQPDSSMLEILVWGDSDNEDFTDKHLIAKYEGMEKDSNGLIETNEYNQLFAINKRIEIYRKRLK